MAKKNRASGEALSGKGKAKLVVVPDACSLGLASAVIPENYFKKTGVHALPEHERPKHFIDIYFDQLSWDKIKGFDLMDVVAAESFFVKPNGECFDSGRQKRLTSEDSMHTYRRIFVDRDAPVSIVRTHQGQRLIDTYSAISKLEEQISGYIATLSDSDRVKKKHTDMSNSIRNIRRKLGRDRGEIIITDYLLSHNSPTLFISDDDKGIKEAVAACEKHNNRACVYVTNTLGFLKQLKEAGVFKSSGLQDWVTPEMIVKEMTLQRYKSTQALKSNLSERGYAMAGHQKKHADPQPVTNWFR